jgi:maltose O-acetyltransferase
MSLIFLWKNREQPNGLSKRWVKVWAKRILNLQGLINIEVSRALYITKGATVGRLTVFEKNQLSAPVKGLSIGERCFIGSNVCMVLHENTVIGNRVVINVNVQLLTGSHGTKDPAWLLVAKPIIIQNYVWIAYNAIILPGVTIGKGAVVGAGAVVSRDVPEFSVVAGNPAKVVGRRCKGLEYSPVDFCAPYESWLGKSTRY